MKIISKEKFKLLYKKYTVEELAKKYGVSKSLIVYYAKKLGLQKRKFIVK